MFCAAVRCCPIDFTINWPFERRFAQKCSREHIGCEITIVFQATMEMVCTQQIYIKRHIFIHWIIWKRFLASQECENVKCGKQQIPIRKFRAITISLARLLLHVLQTVVVLVFFLFTPVQRLECEQNAEIIKPIHKTCLIVISANWKHREKLQTVVRCDAPPF